MDQPHCKTCPYWYRSEGRRPIHGAKLAECRRYPVLNTNSQSDDKSWPPKTDWPIRSEQDWCGEHPQFAEFIAAFPTYLDHLEQKEREQREAHRQFTEGGVRWNGRRAGHARIGMKSKLNMKTMSEKEHVINMHLHRISRS
jgi:hypothetical protein